MSGNALSSEWIFASFIRTDLTRTDGASVEDKAIYCMVTPVNRENFTATVDNFL
jgi:hypothetical protein